MIIIELGGDLMKVLFQRKGIKVDFVDLTRRIISIDGKFVNELGEEIQVEEPVFEATYNEVADTENIQE